MVVAEAISGLSGLKTAFDIARTLKDLDDRARRNAAVIELQESILSAQAAQATLIEKVRDLEAEMARMKTWDTDKQRYELKDLWKGFFAYILKEGMENGETPHAICTNCYQNRFKSILQNSGHPVIHDRSWDCPSCKSKAKNQRNDMAALIEFLQIICSKGVDRLSRHRPHNCRLFLARVTTDTTATQLSDYPSAHAASTGT